MLQDNPAGHLIGLWHNSFQVGYPKKSRRESAHAHPFGGDFELKILRTRGFSARFLDNQPENCCRCDE